MEIKYCAMIKGYSYEPWRVWWEKLGAGVALTRPKVLELDAGQTRAHLVRSH